ncbi:DC-STAMP domain-containing protein 2 [Caerostris extrusa]|uniref:DC-STAMP domain-containing protein 2 n=1 Tax=Caerostris extrusa TaxID=172846 RepID=A0AAV4S3G2_CAEEX|nr:DC-STAMP domain-containing protein 2 [Caerostris extrusa]
MEVCLSAIIDVMRDILKALKEFARMMKEAFIAIRDLFLEIINAIKAIFQWLKSIVSVCSSKYGSPYERCGKAFDDAIADCEVKMGAFKFLCSIVTAVKFVCEIAREFKSFARHMYNEFYVNVTFFCALYNFSLEQSKSFEDIRGDIQDEIRKRTDWFIAIIDWTNLTMAFFFAMLLFKSYVYRIRYLTADHFDNVYISHYLRDIDERRSMMGKETILPLTHREPRRYVRTFSPRMAASEKQAHGGRITSAAVWPAGWHNHATGLLTARAAQDDELLRKTGVQRTAAHRHPDPVYPEFDFTQCLPTPVPLNLDKYRTIARWGRSSANDTEQIVRVPAWYGCDKFIDLNVLR